MAKQDLTTYRSTAYNMTYTHTEDMTGGTVYFTVKSDEFDDNATDSDAMIKKDITSFINAGKTASWTLTDADMYIEPDTYYYDIVYEPSNKLALPPIFIGNFKVLPHPTNRNVGNE